MFLLTDNMVWQGAYVFSVTANGDFTLKGTVTHLNSHYSIVKDN